LRNIKINKTSCCPALKKVIVNPISHCIGPIGPIRFSRSKTQRKIEYKNLKKYLFEQGDLKNTLLLQAVLNKILFCPCNN
jgi:hypothetical protein